MRMVHTADWHLGDRLGRIDRTADLRRAVERVAAYCESERADVLLVAGDLFSELSRPDGLRDTMGHLREVFEPFLARGGSIVALTGNHDNETFCRTLRHALRFSAPEGSLPGRGRLHLADEPRLLHLPDGQEGAVQFVLMPYPSPAKYLSPPLARYANLEEKARVLRAAFLDRLATLTNSPEFRPDLPTVLSAHVHVQGARLATPFRLDEREGILLPDEGLAGTWAYVALGHIHQPQSVLGRIDARYSGSVERLDAGEADDLKGAVLIDIGREGLREPPALLPLDATPFLDIEIRDPGAELPSLTARFPDAGRALVRYHLTYRPGVDNLDAILDELDRVFPRWYERDCQRAGECDPLPGSTEIATGRGFAETVLDYLDAELLGHPDRDAVRALADVFLAEEPPAP